LARKIVEASVPFAEASVLCSNRSKIEELRIRLHRFRFEFAVRAATAVGWKIGRDKHAKKLAAAATTLLEWFAKPQDGLLERHLWWRVDAVSRDDLVAALAQLKHAAANPPKVDDNDGSLRDWVSKELENVYNDCFDRSDKYTRDSFGAITGGLVSFIQAVAAEIRLEISNDTIAKAVSEKRITPTT
jgi:hypothetical protein